MATRNLPAGTVTFLFTDVEGSTQLLHDLGAEAFAQELASHRRTIRDASAAHGGVEVDTQGDAFFVAFPTASGALAAAERMTQDLATGPIRVRIGLHTGTPMLTDEGYIGPDVHQGARIAAAGHGGQVLVSDETRQLVDGEFLDLGEHRLKDFAAPVWIHQLGVATFPPLKTISNTNLPRPASPLIGREREVADVVTLIRDGARLLTLTGPGGTGKTRLAIEVATRLTVDFRSGAFWVPAAPLREPGLVLQAIGQVLGARHGLAEHIGERELLLLVDNLEQVPAIAPELAALVERCPNLSLVLTSRERLHARGERTYEVPAMAALAAVALYRERSGAGDDPAIGMLCEALDNLPLAIELAASRASVLSASAVLDRLSTRLDLLRGSRDADARQQTLRATIDWSHDLLTDTEQLLFARLSVFAGGGTLSSVEAVTDADVDTLQSLVEKSLVHHADDRFGMLESIRAYAGERLDASGGAHEVRRRHAAHYLALAEEQRAILDAGEPEEGPVDVLEAEVDNLRAAADFGIVTGDVDLVRRLTAALPMYWIVRGLYREGRMWLDRAIALAPDARDETARGLLTGLATIAYALGDHLAAVEAADEAAIMSAELAGTGERSARLRDEANAALLRGDNEVAESLYRERLPITLEARNWVGASSCRINLALIANRTARHEQARALLIENLPFVRARGQSRCEASTLAGLAETSVRAGRPLAGTDDALAAARLAFEIRDRPLAIFALEALAASVAAAGDPRAATLLGAADAERQRLELEPDPDEAVIRDAALESLGPDPSAYADAWAAGTTLDLPAALDLASAISADLRTSAAA